MDVSSFIQDLGRSFIISSFVPAAVFILVVTLLLLGISPIPEDFSENPLGQPLIYLLIFSVSSSWLGYVLYSGTRWTIQLYEGYFFPGWLTRILTFYQRRWLRKRSIHLKQWIDYINDRKVVINQDTNTISQKALVEIQSVEPLSPLDENHVLPTRFGNILRSSELYANERYPNLNGLVVWPRLYKVLPQNFINQMEERNNQMVFLVNSSFLAILTGFSSFGAGILLLIWRNDWHIVENFRENLKIIKFIHPLQPVEYLLVGVAFFLLGFILYKFTIPSAIHFTAYIRSGFDLYRFDLLKAMNIKIPKNSGEEVFTWRKVSELLAAGNRLSKKPHRFDYILRPELNQETEEKDAPHGIKVIGYLLVGSGRRRRTSHH